MTIRKLAGAALSLALGACSGGGGGGGPGSPVVPGSTGDVVVLAWNDLGMHCLNPSYDTLVILPPYNTIWAQVIQRGERPRLLTEGITVRYRILGNTYSAATGVQLVKGRYAQFWTFASIFGAAGLHLNQGLDLAGPERFGLEGTMVARTRAGAAGPDHFEANGIPLVPMDDTGVWNPFQVAEITVTDGTGRVIARTQATAPTSDEINCDKCHRDMGPTADAFQNILALHDEDLGTALRAAASAGTPALCGGCHATPALGILSATHGATTYVSGAIHGFHGRLAPDERPACYDCHPGPRTQCSRSTAHVMGAADGNCTHCHGALPAVGATGTPAAPLRTPWASEPACANCHAGVPEVDTGASLYRNARGHGGLSCPACHGSPHAMVPSRVDSDNFQAQQYQGRAVTLGDCRACHDTSRPGGTASFLGEHGASAGHASACNVCHTTLPAEASTADNWPHGFAWKARTRAP